MTKRRINQLLLIISIAWAIYLGYFFYTKWEKANNNAPHIEVYEVNGGWGYNIKVKNRVMIHQPFIPVLKGKVPFPSKKSARKTANLVLDRLKLKQSPALTEEDIKNIAPEVMK